ncbi:hypothetical protein DHEL01_v209536 [Diaporthe helianthi]|uniref:Uncharacterized protein n=1 Tax=Diaporthe helianthi TaxID=158607 RepID=A0A2P5HPD0_DIAHE|nr:hypothetical protein DHEL01_v209536 [Diaporthe helianthi]
MCFMVENCKWCQPEAQPRPRSELGTVPKEQEEEESAAVNSLRECLETLQRDRLLTGEARMRGRANNMKCPGLVQRCLNMVGSKAAV